MKIEGMKGEFWFKCLYQTPGQYGWFLSEQYFSSYADAAMCGYGVQWPVEVHDGDKYVYVPTQEEIDDL